MIHTNKANIMIMENPQDLWVSKDMQNEGIMWMPYEQFLLEQEFNKKFHAGLFWGENKIGHNELPEMEDTAEQVKEIIKNLNKKAPWKNELPDTE